MSIENFDTPLMPPTYDIDISEAWDTESQKEVFLRELKKLPFYRSGLLHSGFNGDMIGKSWGSTEGNLVVFCATEEDIKGEGGYENPLEYAFEYDNPAIAIYNPTKLEYVNPNNFEVEGYKIKDPTAIIGIIKLKL